MHCGGICGPSDLNFGWEWPTRPMLKRPMAYIIYRFVRSTVYIICTDDQFIEPYGSSGSLPLFLLLCYNCFVCFIAKNKLVVAVPRVETLHAVALFSVHHVLGHRPTSRAVISS